MLQPWIETRQTWSASGFSDPLEPSEPIPASPAIELLAPSLPRTPDPLRHYLEAVKGWITDLLLLGLESSDPQLLAQLSHLCDQGRSLGFNQLLTPLEILAAEFSRKANDRHWQSDRSGQALRELLLWLSFAPSSGSN